MFLGYISLIPSKILFSVLSLRRKKDLPPQPYLKVTDKSLMEGFTKIFERLKKNLKPPLRKIKHFWAIPSGIFFGCYLWDSVFISQIWKYWDVNIGCEILKPLIDNQAEDGRIPHFVNPFMTASKTQPPLIAWAISNMDASIEYLKEFYPALKRYNQWLYENRRLDNGLFYWMHSYESGIDNSPRFTDRSEKIKRDLTKIAVIDLNSYIVLQNRSLISIAKKLDEAKMTEQDFKSDIIEFEKKNKILVELIQEYLWDEEFGLYFDYDTENQARIEINTLASFLPLIAGIPNKQQTSLLLKHLESPYEYHTKISLPSVAHNEKNFIKDMWRGPVWINLAYLIIKGLEKKELYKLSSDLAYKIVKGVFQTWKNEGSFYEFYDPDRYDLKELSRKKGNLYKRLTLGKKPVKNFVGWTGLVNSFLIESIIGFDINEKTIQPRFPEDFRGKNIELGFPALDFILDISYSSEKDILIKVSDLQRKKEDFIIKCSLYQKVSLMEFFSN